MDIASEGEAQRYDAEPNVDDAPIVRYVNKVLMDAIGDGASDIHFEPYEKYCRIRFRQDGLLREVSNPPVNIAARLVARLKVMSRMNIAELRVPQDGRIKLKVGRDREIDFRVSTLPTLYGEKVVLRILDAAADLVGIDHLGFEPEQKSVFLSAIQKPYGMILVTGPTGSGKTVSLYSALDILNRSEVNISTVEDPVEIRVPGINQVNMNVKTGLTFAAALQAFLRQDPDIVMVGEIRDPETAEIAVKARPDGTPGALHPAHQRRTPIPDPAGEYGHPPLQYRLLGAPDHGPASGAAALSPLQGARAASTRCPVGRRLRQP